MNTKRKSKVSYDQTYDISLLFDSYEEDDEEEEGGFIELTAVHKYTSEEGFEEFEDLGFLDEYSDSGLESEENDKKKY